MKLIVAIIALLLPSLALTPAAAEAAWTRWLLPARLRVVGLVLQPPAGAQDTDPCHRTAPIGTAGRTAAAGDPSAIGSVGGDVT